MRSFYHGEAEGTELHGEFFNMKTVCSRLVIIFFLSLPQFISAQISDTIRYDKDSNIVSVPKPSDGVYTVDRSDRTVTIYPWLLNTPVYSYDTAMVRRSEQKILYYKNNFSSPPLRLEECLYVNPALTMQSSLHAFITNPDKNYFVMKPLPAACLFYSDTLSYYDKNDYATGYRMYFKLKRPLEDFYQPFYFKKTEVTNKEYREFTSAVRDSVMRTLLAESGDKRFVAKTVEGDKGYLLNYDVKIDLQDSNVVKSIEPIYHTMEERYYKRKEIDTRLLNYVYFNADSEKCIVNIYPDTLHWVDDFTEIEMESYTNMYNWHKAYDDYPVVGITALQAEAFLYWKTKQKQAELDRKHINYTVKYELPDEMEWELVATANKKNNYAVEYMNFYDRNFITSLSLLFDTAGYSKIALFNDTLAGGWKEDNGSEGRPQNYKLIFLTGERSSRIRWPGDSVFRLCLFNTRLKTSKESYPEMVISASKDENGVLFMGNNVSEWMRDTYKENWLPVYTYHQDRLKKISSAYYKQLLELERFYNKQNDPNGYLIRGANWYDNSMTTTGNKNFEGINKKVFKDPSKSFATVGFRYVVKFYKKKL
ncbi:MAG: Sulphatase-modifying factor protein [Bacteroidetes bacterium]|nr:Sulphatase-modifying factor protein [Bacteroidota bacterium]